MSLEPPRSVYTFVGSNPGPGIFNDERVRQCTKQAYRSICKFLRSPPPGQVGADWRNVKTTLRPALLEIVRHYWADWDYDHRLDRAKIRADVKAFRKGAASMLCALRALELDARQTINDQAVSHLRRGGINDKDALLQLRDMTLLVGRASLSIAREANVRIAKTSLKNACHRSSDLWKELFNGKFSRNFVILPMQSNKSKNAHLQDFVKREHQFVHLIVHCLNSQTTAKQVRSALGAVSERRSKK